jgi:hypothetical protein
MPKLRPPLLVEHTVTGLVLVRCVAARPTTRGRADFGLRYSSTAPRSLEAVGLRE